VGDEFTLLVIGILILLSGLVSATETALLALGPAGVHQILEEERRKVRLLAQWRDNPNAVIASILVVNNLLNILASALATALASRLLERAGIVGAEGLGVAAAVGVMTLLLVLFGEVTPKTFAKHRPRALVPFMTVSHGLCWTVRPLSWFFERTSSWLLAGAGLRNPGREPAVTEQEIESMIRLGTAQGALPSGKQELLSSVIEFSETLAKEILVPRTDVIGFEEHTTLDDALRIVNEHQYSRYPVYRGSLDTIVGIVNVKDLLRLQAPPRPVCPQDWLTRLAQSRRTLFVPETRHIRDLLKDLQRERVQMAIVVDEFGGTSGIVTVEDVLEEIVGEIWDEHDQAEEPIRETGDGTFLVEATCPIEDFAERLGIQIPDQGDFETVGGLVLTLAGKVPQAGERLSYQGWPLVVAERTRTRVIRVAVGPKEVPGAEANGQEEPAEVPRPGPGEEQ